MAGSFQQFYAKICAKRPIHVLTADPANQQIVSLNPEDDVIVVGFDVDGISRYKILTASGIECVCPLKYVKPV